MRVSDFDFNLPPELIAQEPLAQRDSSRMLVVDQPSVDSHISDFISYIKPGDVVVFNNSKVIPCRFSADGYEFTLHTKTDNGWWALAKKFGKLKIGDKLKLEDGTNATVLDKDDSSGVLLEFDSDDVFSTLEKIGKMPLPPYIKNSQETQDKERYQTVYANPLGSMAAPTAGLHFTPQLLSAIERAGAKIVNVTLHVGAGTWAPVNVEDTRDHKMHSEWGCITAEQADTINNAKRVIAVGTTSLRLLESAAVSLSPTTDGKVQISQFCGTTNIFITPGYQLKVVDVLLTNFHFPRSTLFMLVCAFAGTDVMKAAYQHAINEKYRFFSYGDCCLLFRK